MTKTATESKLVDEQYRLQDLCSALDRIVRNTASEESRLEIWNRINKAQRSLSRVEIELRKIRS